MIEMKRKQKLQRFDYIVLRSKRTGHYFKFVQYYDDGYGMYEDNISIDYGFSHNDCPALFLEDEDIRWCDFKDHTENDVERVKFTIIVGE